MATLINNSVYRIRNLAFAKYIKPNGGGPPNVLGHHTFLSTDTLFNFTVEGVVLITEPYWKFKTADNKYWTVPESGTGPLTVESALTTTGNAYHRQLFRLIDVSAGVVMLEPRNIPNGRIQVAGPLPDEGRYIQIFTQVNQPQEQFAFELISSAAVDVPTIQTPIYTDFSEIIILGVESEATIQLYKNGQAYGPQRQNTALTTANISVSINGLVKGEPLKVEAFKAGEANSTSPEIKVEEFVGVVKVTPPTGAVTYNVEILQVISGSSSGDVNAIRFNPAKILSGGLSNAAAALSYMTTNNYIKTQL